ncbi:glycosyltransferase family A protein [Paenibacillus eucommiae]|uniref:Glycosyltransferase involved in cell wall biosynthesis n=1 Tax=Paenibacillus eucommiae TaxID=1355755 RepID=A0ABS4IRU8_9BACL|nr:glycosyltransferase family 2 protein [Paenibacillus eucommiae]MBP1990291.1 glycosyltransferase involved in cell wall biosynthesis [Paenibacillus eucommiae]
MYSLIVPTLGKKQNELVRLLDSLLEQKNVNLEIIIAVQDNHKSVEKIIASYSDLNIVLLNLNRRGLSYARNEALKCVTQKIITFSDDDCWYPADIFNEIHDIVINNAISTFNIYDPIKNKFYKNYSKNKKNYTSVYTALKVSSIEIFINTNLIDKNQIDFDTLFGLGAIFPSGEENTLLLDLLKNNNEITYVPVIAVYHEKKDNILLGEKNLEAKGAFFARNFNYVLSLFLSLAFISKKYKLLGKPSSGLKSILKGRNMYYLEKKKLAKK